MASVDVKDGTMFRTPDAVGRPTAAEKGPQREATGAIPAGADGEPVEGWRDLRPAEDEEGYGHGV